VRDGDVLTIDIEATVAALKEGQRISISSVRQRDWAQRGIDEMSPMVYPMAE
jgi:hypothetical protein